METANIRFRKLRKACDKTQAEIGKILGISVSGISDIESGRRNVTEQHLIMLSNWKEKRINIDWIRDGVGEMFLELLEGDEVATLVSDLLEVEGNAFYDVILDIMRTYNELDPKSQDVLMRTAEKFTNIVARKKGD